MEEKEAEAPLPLPEVIEDADDTTLGDDLPRFKDVNMQCNIGKPTRTIGTQTHFKTVQPRPTR